MSTFKQQLQLFKNQSYSWFLFNSLLATLGNGIAYVALTWIVIKAHSTPSSVAVLMISFWLPMVIFGPFCGVISDRFHRISVMIVSNLVRAVILIACGFYLKNHYNVYLIYFVTFINGLMFSLYSPAVLTFVRELVTKKQLLFANTQLDITYEVGNVVGMALAGFVMAVFSSGASLIINGTLFVVASIALLFVKYESTHQHMEKRSYADVYADFKRGLSYLLERRSLCAIYSIQLFIFVQFMTGPILLAPFAHNILHTTAGEFGQIEASLSAGVIIGGLLNPFLVSKWGIYKVLIAETILGCISFRLFSMTHHFYSAAMIYFLIGLAVSAWPLMVTRAQQMTELNYQGRVQGVFNSLSGMSILLLYLVVFLIGDVISIKTLYLFEVLFGIGIVVLLVTNRSVLIKQ